MSAPTGYSSLGLIGFTDRGNYNPSYTYMKNDLCHSGGKMWKSKVDENTGNTPTEGSNWTVWIDEISNLSELSDVSLNYPADGDEISYNGTSNKWTNTNRIKKETDIRAKLGAHNLNKSELSYTFIKSSADSKNFYIGGISGLKAQEMITIDFDVSDVSGYTGTSALKVNLITPSGISPQTDCATSATHYTATADIFNDIGTIDDNVYFTLYIPSSEGSAATVTISNVLIKYANDESTKATPFAEDNEVLTNKVISIGSEVSQLKNAFTNQVHAADAKNLYTFETYSQTLNSVAFTVNDDLSISTANTSGNGNTILKVGTLAKGLTNVHLSGCPSGGSQNAWCLQLYDATINDYLSAETGNGKNYSLDATHEYQIRIVIRASQNMSGKTFKPMITLSTTPDSDYAHYAPPAKTNRQLTQDSVSWTDEAQIGAVNYCQNNATSDSGGGLTYTVNANKSVTVAATGGTYPFTVTSDLYINLSNGVSFAKGTYNRSGCPSGGSLNTYFIGGSGYADIGDGCVFTLSQDSTIDSVIVIKSGTVLTSALTFYPMITDLSYNGPYVPHAKTNRELTELTVTKYQTVSANGLSFAFSKVGHVAMCTFFGSASADITGNTNIATIPDGYRPVAYQTDTNTTNKLPSTSDFMRIFLMPNGGIQAAGNIATGDPLRGCVTYPCE